MALQVLKFINFVDLNCLPLIFFSHIGGTFYLLLFFYVLFFARYWFCAAIYLIYIYFDSETPNKGGRPNDFFRKNVNSEYYFPIAVSKVNGCELETNKNYFFVSVPHGLTNIGMGHGCHRGFNEIFPKHKFYVITLDQAFKAPILREFLFASGAISASKKSIEYVLKQGNGHVLGLCPGGAEEVFYHEEYKTVIKSRKGFVKIALEFGADLVPVISFGEIDIYKSYKCLESLQRWFKQKYGFVPIIPRGRGWIQPSVIPFRKPINVVVGLPIHVNQVRNPTTHQIDELHTKFVESLEKLFESEKYKYIANAENVHLQFV